MTAENSSTEEKDTLGSIRDWYVNDSANHSEVPVTIPELTFRSTLEESYLSDSAGRKFVFRQGDSPQAAHTYGQVCKAAKVPYAFFKGNKGASRESILNEWIKSVDPESDKATMVLKVRKGASVDIIRALLPLTTHTMSPVDLCSHLLASGLPANAQVLLFDGRENDSPSTHLRVSTGEEVSVFGSMMQVGVAITFSEVDAAQVVGDIFLYDSYTKLFYFASFGGNPHVTLDPSKVQDKDFGPAILSLVKEAMEVPEYLQSYLDHMAEYPGDDRALALAVQGGILPRAFYSPVHREMQGREEGGDNHLSLASAISTAASEQKPNKRLALERAAGSLLGLMFARKGADDAE